MYFLIVFLFLCGFSSASYATKDPEKILSFIAEMQEQPEGTHRSVGQENHQMRNILACKVCKGYEERQQRRESVAKLINQTEKIITGTADTIRTIRIVAKVAKRFCMPRAKL